MGHGVAKEMGSRVTVDIIYSFLKRCYWESSETGWAQYSGWDEFPANTAIGTAACEIGLLRHGLPKTKKSKRSKSSFWASSLPPTVYDAHDVMTQYKIVCDRYNEGRVDPEPMEPISNPFLEIIEDFNAGLKAVDHTFTLNVEALNRNYELEGNITNRAIYDAISKLSEKIDRFILEHS